MKEKIKTVTTHEILRCLLCPHVIWDQSKDKEEPTTELCSLCTKDAINTYLKRPKVDRSLYTDKWGDWALKTFCQDCPDKEIPTGDGSCKECITKRYESVGMSVLEIYKSV